MTAAPPVLVIDINQQLCHLGCEFDRLTATMFPLSSPLDCCCRNALLDLLSIKIQLLSDKIPFQVFIRKVLFQQSKSTLCQRPTASARLCTQRDVLSLRSFYVFAPCALLFRSCSDRCTSNNLSSYALDTFLTSRHRSAT